MSSIFGGLMSVVYRIISAVLLAWHSVWDTVLGGAHGLATDWAWVLGIVFLVLTVRAVLFPLFVRQVRSQQAMQRLQPKVKALREKHKGDAPSLQAALTELYREEKVNPVGSFLPMLLQFPILLGLFHVLRHLRPTITSEASQTLYGWTVTQFTDASHARLFGAPISAGFQSPGLTVKLVAGALILAMITTTYLTSRMSILRAGWSEDPQQRLIQRVMLYVFPASLLISGFLFPVGVILYWTTQNLFALGQQAYIQRRHPAPTPVAETPEPVHMTVPKVGAKPGRRR